MLRPPALAAAILLLAPGQHSSVATSRSIAEEFPPQDLSVLMLQQRGVQAFEAEHRLREAPEHPDTLRLLARAGNVDRMLRVLRAIVDSRPRDIPAAFEAFGEEAWRFRGDDEATAQYSERMRQLLAEARKRLPGLPREDAARAARAFVTLDAELSNDPRNRWTDRMARFVEEYRGTETALLAEVDLIGSGAVSQKLFDRLDAFIEGHPGTVAAAKALYLKGFHWHTINTLGVMEPRGADPTDRFMRVLSIVNELEGGRYRQSEWVDKAPSLISEFFIPDGVTIAPENVDRLLAVYRAHVRTHFVLDHQFPSRNAIGYVVTSRMADLFERKGERIEGVERVLTELESSGPDPSAVRYLRAVFWMDEANGASPPNQALMARARQELALLGAQGRGLYHRKALATLAALEFEAGNFDSARVAFRQYTASYPETGWAWVALLRTGQCEERLGNPSGAAEAYLAAADRHADLALARVLGHEYAARAYETAGAFDKALVHHQRALGGWDPAFGTRYSTYVRQSPRPRDPFVPSSDTAEVAQESLAPRIAQLKKSLAAPGGVLLERGRSLLVNRRYQDAAAELQRMLEEHPDSPVASAARALAHRARLEHALQLADVEGPAPDEDAARKALESLAREPTDFAVTAGRIALASMLWTHGEAEGARKLMREALDEWHARQRPSQPANPLEEDVAEIRRAVFLPRGGAIYEDGRWNAFRWPSTAPPFALVNADVRVKDHDGDITRLTLVQEFAPAQAGKILFFDTEQIALLKVTIQRLGGTRRRESRQIMETPNQPVGDSMQVLRLWTTFFPARPGHWGGWEIETYPVITEVHFPNEERTKARVRVTVGYSGATVELEKEAGAWVARRLTSQWVT
jgi:tetratricopeptide (TPR) repeat protein